MVISRSAHSDSEPYVMSFSYDEFLHLYGVICSILYEDDSDKLLVKMEDLMVDLL